MKNMIYEKFIETGNFDEVNNGMILDDRKFESKPMLSAEVCKKWKSQIKRLSVMLKIDIAISISNTEYLICDKEIMKTDLNQKIKNNTEFDSPSIKWPDGQILGYFCMFEINKMNINENMRDMINDYITAMENDLRILYMQKKYDNLYKREKNISKIAQTEKHYKKILSKSFTEKDDILGFIQIDLDTGIVMDCMTKFHTPKWIGKHIDSFVDYNLININDGDKAKYLFFYSLDFLKDSAKKEKRIAIEYNQRFEENIVLVKATIEFVNYPNDDENMAFIYIQDISIPNELNKLLNVIVDIQNEYVMRIDTKTRNINIYASSSNFLKLPMGFSTHKFWEYEKKINECFEKYDMNIEKDDYSSDKLFEIIKPGETHSKILEFDDEKSNHVIKRMIFHRNRKEHESLYMIMQDVTDVVISERKIRNKLEDTLKEINDSKKIAEDANNIKDSFLSNISHEMRTPLNAIIGLTNFGINETETEKDREYFRKIKSNSEYLLLLITDMLDLQKLAGDTLFLENRIFRLTDLRRIIMNIITIRAKDKNIELETKFEDFEMFPFVKADEKRIGQALINILNNAIKYTNEGGKVYWKSETIGYTKEKVIKKYTIRDTGVGISEELQKNMYKPFIENGSINLIKQRGTGLGLAICKNIIESMKGTITCDSEIGVGTTFTVVVPYLIADDDEINEYLEKMITCDNFSKLHNRRILICEDVKVNAVILKKILTSEGMVVDLAQNGQVGVEKVKEIEYDAVLMDIRMPVMDGLRATEEIRKFNKEIPIIAVSANAYKSDIEQSIKVGMNAHISKPIRRELLLECLKKHIK